MRQGSARADRSWGKAWQTAAIILIIFGATDWLRSEDKKPGDAVRIIAVAPLEIVVGAKTTLRLRGLKLDGSTAVKVLPPAAELTAVVGEKKKVTVPNGAEANKVGDTEVAVELLAPATLPRTPLKLVVETPDGSTAPAEVQVIKGDEFADEKEPNGSFREAQLLTPGKGMRGCIKEDKDVDVYRFEAHLGARIAIEVRAARLGSLLDSVLTLYGEKGNQLAINDDAIGLGRDSRIEMIVPADGSYLVSITDAQDSGSAFHNYELQMKETP